MNRRTLLLLALALSSGASPAQTVDVSMVSLLANPKAFDGKRVRLIGYVRLEFEGDSIYLHQDDARHAIYKNGLWLDVDIPPKQRSAIDKRYALVEGVFSMQEQGHLGLWSGSIKGVTRLEPRRPE